MKVLIFGGSGLVGSRFIDLFEKDLEIKFPTAQEVDILNKDQVLKFTEDFNPDALINFAAYTNVEEAQNQKDDKGGICYLINAVGAKNVAEASKKFGKKLIHISTEYVFDGQKESPYNEEDKPNPINWYGQTKYFAEEFVLESGCDLILVRISMPFRASYELRKDIARFFLDQLQKGIEITAVENQKITPTLVDDIANALFKILEKEEKGIYHVCSVKSTTPFEFAKTIAQFFNLDKSLVNPISIEKFNENKKAKLLKNSRLDSSKFVSSFGRGILHTIEEGVEIFKQQLTGAT